MAVCCQTCAQMPQVTAPILGKLFLRSCKKIILKIFGFICLIAWRVLVRLFKQLTCERVIKGTGCCGPGSGIWSHQSPIYLWNLPKGSKFSPVCLEVKSLVAELMLTGWYEMCLYWFQREGCYEEAFPKTQGWLVRNHFVLNNSEADAKVN